MSEREQTEAVPGAGTATTDGFVAHGGWDRDPDEPPSGPPELPEDEPEVERPPGVFTKRQVAFLGLVEAAPLAVGFAIGMNVGSALTAGLAVAVGLALAGLVAHATRHRVPPPPLYQTGSRR